VIDMSGDDAHGDVEFERTSVNEVAFQTFLEVAWTLE
jgi:hypothetical protein